jgi:hypothetical protein
MNYCRKHFFLFGSFFSKDKFLFFAKKKDNNYIFEVWKEKKRIDDDFTSYFFATLLTDLRTGGKVDKFWDVENIWIHAASSSRSHKKLGSNPTILSYNASTVKRRSK